MVRAVRRAVATLGPPERAARRAGMEPPWRALRCGASPRCEPTGARCGEREAPVGMSTTVTGARAQRAAGSQSRGKQRRLTPLMAVCRAGCGACCIAPSISPSWPSLPQGKAAGERCPHLTVEIRCALFGSPERPAVCVGLSPSSEMCGESASEAMATLVRWETLTAPRR